MKIKVYNLSETEKNEVLYKAKEAEIIEKAEAAAEKPSDGIPKENPLKADSSFTENIKENHPFLPSEPNPEPKPHPESKKSEAEFHLPKAKPERFDDFLDSLKVSKNSEEPHKVSDIRSKSFIIDESREPIFTTEILSEHDESSCRIKEPEHYAEITPYPRKKRNGKKYIAAFLLLSLLTCAILFTFYGLLKQKVYPPKTISDFMVAFYEDDVLKALPKLLLLFSGFEESALSAGNSYLYNQSADEIEKQADTNGNHAESENEGESSESSNVKVLSDDTPQAFADGKAKYPLTESDLSRGSDKIYINNETNFPIDIDQILKSAYPSELKTIPQGAVAPTFSSIEPVVLILHTHGTESYASEDSNYYDSDAASRSKDMNQNVVNVGAELKKTLERYGIPTIHCEIMHDEVSYINAYSNSLKTVNEYLEKYPSIKYVIDVHRDSIVRDTGEKIKPHTVIAGEECAQLMFVIGSSGGGAYHPNWKQNLNTAVKIQNEVNTEYPTLMRPINIRNSRFNQQVKAGAFILEVGSCGNTLEEAKNAIRLFGKCLAKTISEN